MKSTGFLTDDDVVVITAEEARDVLKISRGAIYNLINRPDCPFKVHRIGKSIRIDKASFLESLDTGINID